MGEEGGAVMDWSAVVGLCAACMFAGFAAGSWISRDGKSSVAEHPTRATPVSENDVVVWTDDHGAMALGAIVGVGNQAGTMVAQLRIGKSYVFVPANRLTKVPPEPPPPPRVENPRATYRGQA